MNIPHLLKIPKSLCVLSTGLLLGRWLYTAKHNSFMHGFDLEVFLHLHISIPQSYSQMHCPSHTQSGVHGRPAFTHLHLLLQLCLQPQWTSFFYSWQLLLIWLSTLVAYVTLFGKTRLNENSIVAFSRCNAFSTRWKCIEEHFQCVLKRWQCFPMEPKCIGNPFQNHFKTLSTRFQTLTTHSMKRPAIWNHS